VHFVEADDHVAVKTHQRGRGKGSGVEVESEIWFVFARSVSGRLPMASARPPSQGCRPRGAPRPSC
jgi:hypothetical protein